MYLLFHEIHCMPSSDEGSGPTRRTILKSGSALAAGGFIAGCSGGGSGGGDSGSGQQDTPTQQDTPSQQDTPTATATSSYSANIGQVGFDLGSIPHTAAVREWLESETNGQMSGTIKNFSSGTLQLQSLVSGDIKFYTSAPGNPYNAQLAGNDLRIIGTKISGTDYVMAVSEDVSSYDDFANSDLSFGISSPGALSHIQPVGVFNEEGISTDAVNFVKIGGSSERTQALAAGNVDGAAIHMGQMQRLQNQEVGVKSLGLVKDYFPNFVQETIVTTADFLEDPVHEEFTQAYIDQLYRANKRAMNDYDWVYQMTQKYQAQPISKEDLKPTWDLNVNELEAWPYTPDTGFVEEGYRGVLDMMHNGGLLDKNEVPFDQMWEPKYADNAISKLE